VLRLGGVDLYDRWMAGEVGFEDSVVRDAFTHFGQIAFADRFVRYGTDAISRTSHFDAMDHLATDPPGCWMNYTGSWQQNSVRDATGGDAGFFVLPPIEPRGDAPVLGAPFMIGATLAAGLQRPDASDEMPAEVGGLTGADQRGVFLQGMLDYVDEGPESLDHVLADIDAG
jgi:hypothetical protein